MGHACHAKSICSPRKHVRLHEDETQHPRCGHHPSTTDSPTICERNCHEQRLCKSLLETTLDRVAELELSSTWFWKRSIQGPTCRKYKTNDLNISKTFCGESANSRMSSAKRKSVNAWTFLCNLDPKMMSSLFPVAHGPLQHSAKHEGSTHNL